MTENEIIEFVSGFAGVVAMTVSEDSGAPEIAWGDTFFYYDPEGTLEARPRQPFATIVTKDYDGFDTASDLNRPGVFRLNIAVGSSEFERLVGYPPKEHAEHHADTDYTAADRVIPHPVYSRQGWISIVNPGEQARPLLAEAHARAVAHHRPLRAS
ncbi:DUF6194 family protein [Nonomuraea sp. NPDC050786]|uniref:DUF6194 family protein n=1 Tax=Nonomuraea sp. NPDC050786 TaxID=3154840 RepID=UPI00340BD4D0